MNSLRLDYGREGLEFDLQGIKGSILRPRHIEGLADEAKSFVTAVRNPVAGAPLRSLISPHERIAVVIADGTRPLPSERLLPWLFAELSHVPAEQFTIIIGTGSHRANTPGELRQMLGAEIVERYKIVNHDAHNPATLVSVGDSPFGYPVYLNREYVEADRKIIMGFIEPHFMAGFSGGYKAVFPGVAGIETIMQYHSVANIGHELSTWAVLEGNPTQQHVRAGGSLVPVDFCINVTMNPLKQITGIFCGETIDAHEAGCSFVRSHVMVKCPHTFPIVVTTNSGYPLDQNLYQAVKGMSAAAQIVEPGGLIITAARCNDGFPEHGFFKRQLYGHDSVDALLETIYRPGFAEFDRWQTQMFALILKRAQVALYSELPDADVTRAHMIPVHDLRRAVLNELDNLDLDAPVAFLPQGPMTIPYLEN